MSCHIYSASSTFTATLSRCTQRCTKMACVAQHQQSFSTHRGLCCLGIHSCSCECFLGIGLWLRKLRSLAHHDHPFVCSNQYSLGVDLVFNSNTSLADSDNVLAGRLLSSLWCHQSLFFYYCTCALQAQEPAIVQGAIHAGTARTSLIYKHRIVHGTEVVEG